MTSARRAGGPDEGRAPSLPTGQERVGGRGDRKRGRAWGTACYVVVQDALCPQRRQSLLPCTAWVGDLDEDGGDAGRSCRWRRWRRWRRRRRRQRASKSTGLWLDLRSPLARSNAVPSMSRDRAATLSPTSARFTVSAHLLFTLPRAPLSPSAVAGRRLSNQQEAQAAVTVTSLKPLGLVNSCGPFCPSAICRLSPVRRMVARRDALVQSVATGDSSRLEGGEEAPAVNETRRSSAPRSDPRKEPIRLILRLARVARGRVALPRSRAPDRP